MEITQMPDGDVNEAVRLAHILIEKLDQLTAQMAEVKAILRGDTVGRGTILKHSDE